MTQYAALFGYKDIKKNDNLPTTKKLARVAENSSIEHLGKTKVPASFEAYGKNATLANFPNVTGQYKKTA